MPRSDEGFTLVELIVAIFGLGIFGLLIYLMVLIVLALQKYIGG